MLEIHYHLLYATDDGPKDIQASLDLAEVSIAEGVTHIVCTPHANDQFTFRPQQNRERVEELRARLDGRLVLGLGCDFQLSDENLSDFAKDRASYTVNGKRYLLVEFSDFGIPRSFDDVLCGLIGEGVVPIITHPERNPILASRPARLGEWIGLGCLVQITAGSLTGRFGSQAKSVSLQLIKKNWVHLVASDAHGINVRPPELRPAYRSLERQFGADTADRLCKHNPLAVFNGANLPHQPEPLSFGESSEGSMGRILSRVFRFSTLK